jgi:multimeric flavodoxin WrbA
LPNFPNDSKILQFQDPSGRNENANTIKSKAVNLLQTPFTMTKIAIIYYSTYGHVATMTESVKKGIEAAGATCDIFQVPETLPKEVLAKMGAPPKKDHPVITTDQLVDYDGFIFGCSGRYGTFPAQMKVCTSRNE